MADTIGPPVEPPSGISKIENGVEAAAKFVGNGVRAAGQSIAHDAATVVGKDVALGARVEAGVNLAADALSVATLSPEDAALERGAVFAAKEGIEHAPQIGEGAAKIVEMGIERAPQVGKALTSAFERTSKALEASEHKIVAESVSTGLLETKNAVYHIVEGAEHDGTRLMEHFTKATNAGKNFAVHAPELAEQNVRTLRGMRMEVTAEKLGLKADIVDSERGIETSVHEMERGNALSRGISGITKRAEPLTKTFALGKDVKEAVGIGIAAATVVAAQRDHIGHAAHEALHHAEGIASEVGQHIGKTVDATERAVERGAASVTRGAAEVIGDIKHWTPDMSPEHLEKMLIGIRGGNSGRVAVGSQQRNQQRQQEHDLGR